MLSANMVFALTEDSFHRVSHHQNSSQSNIFPTDESESESATADSQYSYANDSQLGLTTLNMGGHPNGTTATKAHDLRKRNEAAAKESVG